jgi:hypothetical protein
MFDVDNGDEVDNGVVDDDGGCVASRVRVWAG